MASNTPELTEGGDDLPCLCETNAAGFIVRHDERCPWPGHPQSARVMQSNRLQQYQAQRAALNRSLRGWRGLFNIGELCDAVARGHHQECERQWLCALLRLRAEQGEAER